MKEKHWLFIKAVCKIARDNGDMWVEGVSKLLSLRRWGKSSYGPEELWHVAKPAPVERTYVESICLLIVRTILDLLPELRWGLENAYLS